jgi:hypothetical protein
MVARRNWIVAATAAVVVAAGLVFVGLAVTGAEPGGGSDAPTGIESSPPVDPATPDAPDAEDVPTTPPATPPPPPAVPPGTDAPKDRPAEIDGVCWVFSGGGWIGAPCPTNDAG